MAGYYSRDKGYHPSPRQQMYNGVRQNSYTQGLKDQVGKACPDCKRTLVGYMSRRGEFGLYCLLKLATFDDRNNPGTKIDRAFLGFTSHRPSRDGKDGFWCDMSSVIFGPDGPPPRDTWQGMRGPARQSQHPAPPLPRPGEPPHHDPGLPF